MSFWRRQGKEDERQRCGRLRSGRLRSGRQRSGRPGGRLLSTLLLLAATALLGPASTAQQGGVTNAHGYAIYGPLKYGPGFAHFDYVNPQAPRGGTYRFASQGVSFDSVNQIALLGTIPPAVMYMSDTLLKQSRDEPASYYCLVCKSISWPDDLSWTEFEIDPRARFDDGHPVTPEDIIFSVNLGHGLSMPSFSRVVQTMARIEKTGPRKVRIHFTMKNNPTLPTVLGTMPIVPQHYWKDRDPFKPTMEVPVSVGPYRLVDVTPGRTVIFRRNPEYWAIDHPVNVGRNNFEFVRNDYYRDSQLLNEAFRVGLSDLRLDMNASDMRQETSLPAVLNGDILRDRLRYDNGAIYNSITFNARRPLLADVRVRKALWLAYDFEWVKRAVLGGDYGRLASYIPNLEFEATGLPSPGELEFLEPYRDQLPAELFTSPPSLPVGGSRERMRANLIEARNLLRDAGFTVADGRLIDPKTRQPVRLELVAYSPLLMNQVALFIRNAAKLGIEIEFRSVDAAQMRHLARRYDFDLLYYRENFAPLPTPGAGLAQLYTSQAADTPSQFNRAGIKEPAIDNAIARMIAATDRPTVVNSLRAVDRILRFKYYSIPLQHMYAAPVGYLPISYWDKFGRPGTEQTWQFPYWSADTWWVDPAKEAALSHGVHG